MNGSAAGSGKGTRKTLEKLGDVVLGLSARFSTWWDCNHWIRL